MSLLEVAYSPARFVSRIAFRFDRKSDQHVAECEGFDSPIDAVYSVLVSVPSRGVQLGT